MHIWQGTEENREKRQARRGKCYWGDGELLRERRWQGWRKNDETWEEPYVYIVYTHEGGRGKGEEKVDSPWERAVEVAENWFANVAEVCVGEVGGGHEEAAATSTVNAHL